MHICVGLMYGRYSIILLSPSLYSIDLIQYVSLNFKQQLVISHCFMCKYWCLHARVRAFLMESRHASTSQLFHCGVATVIPVKVALGDQTSSFQLETINKVYKPTWD